MYVIIIDITRSDPWKVYHDLKRIAKSTSTDNLTYNICIVVNDTDKNNVNAIAINC